MSIQADLQIVHYLVTKIHVEFNPIYFRGKEESTILSDIKMIDPDIDFYVSPIDEKNELYSNLTVNLGIEDRDKPTPLKYSLELFGVFSIKPETSEDLRNKLLPLNPAAMLYGIARGVLGQILGQGPLKDYVLPSVNFAEIYKRKLLKVIKEKSVAKAKKTKSKRPLREK
ncbi:MAG: hypothetical protein AB1656_22050 [Candidatus Omnitrophota bacterium]